VGDETAAKFPTKRLNPVAGSSLTLHHLRDRGYECIERSELPGLEQLDVELLKRCILIAETDFSQAVQTFQQNI